MLGSISQQRLQYQGKNPYSQGVCSSVGKTNTQITCINVLIVVFVQMPHVYIQIKANLKKKKPLNFPMRD